MRRPSEGATTVLSEHVSAGLPQQIWDLHVSADLQALAECIVGGSDEIIPVKEAGDTKAKRGKPDLFARVVEDKVLYPICMTHGFEHEDSAD